MLVMSEGFKPGLTDAERTEEQRLARVRLALLPPDRFPRIVEAAEPIRRAHPTSATSSALTSSSRACVPWRPCSDRGAWTLTACASTGTSQSRWMTAWSCAPTFPTDAGDRYPVIMTHGPYAKWLAFQDGFSRASGRTSEADHPDAVAGSSNRYQNWETVDPEKWVPDRLRGHQGRFTGDGRSPGYLEHLLEPQEENKRRLLQLHRVGRCAALEHREGRPCSACRTTPSTNGKSPRSSRRT